MMTRLSSLSRYSRLVVIVTIVPLLAGCASDGRKARKDDGRIPLSELADKQAAMDAAVREKAQEKAKAFNADAMVHVADNLRRAGNYGAALQIYQQARDREPENVGALLGQGDVFLAVGAGAEAERRFRAALDILAQKDGATRKAEFGRAAAGVARALTRQDKAADALPFFDQAIAAGATDAEFFNYYGVTLDLLGQHTDAQLQYGRGLDRKPDDVALINNLALSFALSENYATAVRLLSSMVTAQPDAVQARKNLALVYGLSGDMTAAEKLVAANRKPAEAQAEIAYIHQIAALAPDVRAKAILIGIDKVPPAPPKMPDAPEAEASPSEAPAAPPAVVDSGGADRKTIAAPKAETPSAAPEVAVQVGSYPTLADAERGWARTRKAASAVLATDAVGAPYYWQADGVVRVLLPVAEGWSKAKTLCDALVAARVGCLARRMPDRASLSAGH